MSYDKPDEIPDSQMNNCMIWHNTAEVIRILDLELRALGLRMDIHRYAKNEYCGDRPEKCTCPHWFQIHVESLFTRIYEPHCYLWVCKRTRVYELRYHEMVDDDFWIRDAKNRTQGQGYVHSYGLIQVAQDIRTIHQGAEVHDYKGEKFAEYYADLFRHQDGE